MPEDIPPHPTDLLIGLIADALVPMLVATNDQDPALARLAVIEMLHAYRVQNQADLLIVAQMVAFGLATLDSLSQSMRRDIDERLKQRCRATAIAMARAQERLRQSRDLCKAAKPAPASHPATRPHPKFDPTAILQQMLGLDTGTPLPGATPRTTAPPAQRQVA
jgi:hypothetical protein